MLSEFKVLLEEFWGGNVGSNGFPKDKVDEVILIKEGAILNHSLIYFQYKQFSFFFQWKSMEHLSSNILPVNDL